jgi:hypothetical protein
MESLIITKGKNHRGFEINPEPGSFIPDPNEQGVELTKDEVFQLIKFIRASKIIKGYNSRRQ